MSTLTYLDVNSKPFTPKNILNAKTNASPDFDTASLQSQTVNEESKL